MSDRPWDQKVTQLDLEELCFLPQEEECSVDRLDHDDSRLIRAEISNQKVKSVPLEAVGVYFLVLSKGILIDDKGDS